MEVSLNARVFMKSQTVFLRGLNMNKLITRGLALFAISISFSLPAWALPSTSFIVAAGSATYTLDGDILNITSAPDTIIDWADFSIDASETINFLQASSSSSVLNRILGGAPSLISGSLLSNGSLSLYNPTGIIFNDALVHVGESFTIVSDNIEIAGGSISITGGSSIIANGGNSVSDFIINPGGNIILNVPEPELSLMLLVGLGLLGMFARRRS
jgi:filamentous hemagglutinin family protein